MSKRPTGTLTDADRLLALREAGAALPDDAEPTGPADDLGGADAATYVLEASALGERTGLPTDAAVDWETDERDAAPMLVVGPVPPERIDDAAYPRRPLEAGDETYLPVPEELLRVDPGGGLGLDLADYDDDNPLLFETVASGEAVGLLPARYADGAPFDPDPLPETPAESDPVARETLAREADADATPRPETVDAPIDPEVLTGAATEADVSPAALADALEAIDRRDLLSVADAAPGREPVTVDDRTALLVPEDAWDPEAASQFAVDAAVLDAARLAHERQAARLLEAADAAGHREALAEGEYAAAVTDERDTVEWDDAEGG